MATFQLNQPVRIKHTNMTGVVVGALVVDQQTFEVQFKVDYTDYNGEPHSRYFAVEQIEAAE